MFLGNRSDTAPGLRDASPWGGGAAAAPPPQGVLARLSPLRPSAALPTRIKLPTPARLPQQCLLTDRLSAYGQWDLPLPEALRREFQGGVDLLGSGEGVAGIARFRSGEGRHGSSS
jgi:enoyl-CoA hydratase